MNRHLLLLLCFSLFAAHCTGKKNKKGQPSDNADQTTQIENPKSGENLPKLDIYFQDNPLALQKEIIPGNEIKPIAITAVVKGKSKVKLSYELDKKDCPWTEIKLDYLADLNQYVLVGKTPATLEGFAYTCHIQVKTKAEGYLDFASVQMPIDLTLKPWISSFSSRVDRICAIKVDGTSSCWFSEGLQSKPLENATTITSLSESTDHSCSIETSGKVKCWGENTNGQLGDPDVLADFSPTAVTAKIDGVLQLSTGTYFTCALLNNHQVSCWGNNVRGRLGNGTMDDSKVPSLVKDLVDVQQIASGNETTCALTRDGQVKCWGSNMLGGLAKEVSELDSSNTPIAINLGKAQNIAIKAGHICAVLVTGLVYCWGENLLPTSDKPFITIPTKVEGLSDVSSVSIGVNHACALLKDGKVSCWGDNTFGQVCGEASCTFASSAPLVVPNVDSVQRVIAGGRSTCAQLSNGKVLCWGRIQMPNDGFTLFKKPPTAIAFGE